MVHAGVRESDYGYDATKELFGRVLHFESKMDRGIYVDFDKLKFTRDENNESIIFLSIFFLYFFKVLMTNIPVW